MTRFAQSSPTGSTGFYADDVMHLSRTGRLVFLSVFGNVEHIRAIGQFMEVFLRLGSLKNKNKNRENVAVLTTLISQEKMSKKFWVKNRENVKSFAFFNCCQL